MRGAHGDPVVIRNAPLLDDGTPMPTRYWLVDPRPLAAGRRGSSRPAACAPPRPRSTPTSCSPRTSATRANATPRSRPRSRRAAPARRRRRHAPRREVPARALRLSPRGRRRSRRALGRGAPRMTRVAASTSARTRRGLLVADVDGRGRDAKLVTLDRRTQITRLGQGVDQRACAASRRDRAHARRARASTATSSTTSASSGCAPPRPARRATPRTATSSSTRPSRLLGVRPELLTGDEEARLEFLGATAGLGEPGPYLVVDVGGGSTEFIVGTRRARRALLDRHRLRAPHRAVPALRPAHRPRS